jgi:hypothetical protein
MNVANQLRRDAAARSAFLAGVGGVIQGERL